MHLAHGVDTRYRMIALVARGSLPWRGSQGGYRCEKGESHQSPPPLMTPVNPSPQLILVEDRYARRDLSSPGLVYSRYLRYRIDLRKDHLGCHCLDNSTAALVLLLVESNERFGKLLRQRDINRVAATHTALAGYLCRFDAERE